MRKQLTKGFVFILCMVFASVSFGQSDDVDYLKFSYIKVQPNEVKEFMDFMNSTWKPLYQSQVESGRIDSWSLYRVFTPGGAEGSYNFIVITAASGLTKFEASHPRDILLMEGKSDRDADGIMNETNELGTHMYTEFWKILNKMSLDEPAPNNAKYMMIDYMQVAPGKDYDYQMLEDEIAKPIHEERQEKQMMEGWELMSLITPGGQEYGYNFATNNYFDELKNVEFGFTEDVVQNALPGTDLPELFNTIFSTRTLVNSEIWELVNRTK